MIEFNWFVLTYFGVTLALLLTSIIVLVLTYRRSNRIKEIEYEMKAKHDKLLSVFDDFEKMKSINAKILNHSDFQKEWEYIHKKVNDFLSRYENTDIAIHVKLLINFYHDPQETGYDCLIDGVINLLKDGFHILWNYSNTTSPNFPTQLKDAIKIRNNSDEILDNCYFLNMNNEDELLPLNFSVLAPLNNELNNTYISFPGDENRNFVLRIEDPGSLMKKFNVKAQKYLSQINMDQVNNNEGWQKLKTKALERLTNNGGQ